jgi:undecaprenyl-diphosphatase
MISFVNQLFIFGAQYVFIISIVVAGIYFLKQSYDQKKNMCISGIVSVIVIYVTALIAGHFYNNPRPFVAEHFIPLIAHSADNGFPSDHMLLVSALAAVVYFYNKKVGLVLLVLSILVAISRVYVGVHHSIDVIASGVISWVVVAIIRYFFMKYRRYKHRSINL